MQINFKARDIRGLTPAVDPTQTDERFALSGKNFAFDTLGPRSMFGDRLLLPQPLGSPIHTQGARVYLRGGDRVFTFTSDGILEWDEQLGGWSVIYVTPDLSNAPYRWTWAYLNDFVFFCHPRTGILVYDPVRRICQPHRGPGVPEEALAICVNNGFLAVLSPLLLSWSQPSNGLDFTPTLGGAGFQVLSERVSGYPTMLNSYTAGILVWTTGGVMRSEFTGDSEVYRHRALETEYRPINSFCTTQINDSTVVILDERGLFQSSGEQPQPLTPVFNEFLLQYIQDNQLDVGQNLRIEWDHLRRFMYVSTSLSYANPLYENCFVLYPALDQWGQFNEPHYGIMPLLINNSDRAKDYFGFVDADGRVRYWDQGPAREVAAAGQSAARMTQNLDYPIIQKPAAQVDSDDGWVLSSSGVFRVVDSSAVGNRAGYYEADGSNIAPAELTGLDSVVRIGMIRREDGESFDRLSEVIGVMIRSGKTGARDSVRVDYTLVPAGVSDEDYNIATGTEDFGLNPLNYVNHGLRVVGTIDAETEFDSATPIQIDFKRGSRHYSCNVTGLWHILELSAVEVGELFHPTTIELNLVDAGRLN